MRGGYSVLGTKPALCTNLHILLDCVLTGRSGRPSYSDPWVDQVNWLAGILVVLYAVIGVWLLDFAPSR